VDRFIPVFSVRGEASTLIVFPSSRQTIDPPALTMTGLDTGLRGGWLLPTVLSTTAGAVDVIGLLALGGLFRSRATACQPTSKLGLWIDAMARLNPAQARYPYQWPREHSTRA
jgi:hypothetical protein